MTPTPDPAASTAPTAELVGGLVRHAADDVPVGAPPSAAIVHRGAVRRRRARLRTAAGAVAVVAAVPLLTVGAVRLAGREGTQGPAATVGITASTPVPAACAGPVPNRLLPTWARGGFTDPQPQAPFVLGDRGDILGVLFGQPLQAPPAAGHGNKILWVSRVPVGSGPLVVDASMIDGTATAHRSLDGGPGPSIVDLPQAGCWRLTLHWSGHVDTVDLRYEP